MKTFLAFMATMTTLVLLGVFLPSKHTDSQAQVRGTNPSIFLITDAYETYSGTAFQLMTKRGPVLVTNKHVCQQNSVMFITIPNEDTRRMVVVKAVSPQFDLCILSPILGIPSLTMADSYRFGDIVKIDGFPFHKRAMTFGKVGPHYISPSKLEPYYLIEYSGIVNPGNSGGPVINTSGQVIGVITIKFVKDSAALRDPTSPGGGFVGLEMFKGFLEDNGY